MTEQRKNRRFDLELPLEIVDEKVQTRVPGYTSNISSSGVLFTASIPLEVGEPIEYVITLPAFPNVPASVELHCTGVVVRKAIDLTFAATLERHRFVRLENRRISESPSLWQSAAAWLSKLSGLGDGQRAREASGSRNSPKAKSAKSES